jgi:epoxyqueuosine reductase
MFNLAHIKRLAHEVGFDLCGVAQCRVFEDDRRFFEGWIREGFASSLDYLKRNVELRADANRLVEGAKSVIVCGISYKNVASEGYPEQHQAKVASYACTTDYHTTIKQMLFELGRRLKEVDSTLSARCFVDSAPIFEKRYAVEAGLGWIGRQSLLITPEYGSFVLLGEIVMTAECDGYDSPLETVGCGECHRCVEACPNGAIGENRVVDTRRCIACRTIEPMASGERVELDGWIFGCDRCQSVCPYNQRAAIHSNPRFNPLFNPLEFDAERWLDMSDDEFETLASNTPITRAGLQRLKLALRKE